MNINLEVRHGGAFGGSPLDRMNSVRASPHFLKDCLDSPSIRVLLVDSRMRLLVRPSPVACIGWLDRKAMCDSPVDLAQPSTVVLGSKDGTIYFAARLPTVETGAFPGGDKSFLSLRSLVADLSAEEAAIAAQAVSLFFFHSRHKFCGSCGHETVPEHGGTRLRCVKNMRGESFAVIRGGSNDGHPDGSCSGMWFPRIDCVSIMLVVSNDGTKCLLGRAGRFRPGMWSCLAGFFEHGERLEDAARREVLEESGVVCGPKVRYFGCQPWPQPYSLMLGCVVQSSADGEVIKVDEAELESARWFTRAQVTTMVTNACEQNIETPGPLDDPTAWWVPPTTSIAGCMLQAFSEHDPITCFPPARM
jgi:NAD+ diphosphatase